MGYDLKLNRDIMSSFGPKLDPNEGGHMARHGPCI